MEEERSRIREELKAARVEASTIEEVTKASGGTAKEQIAAMQEAATTEIVGEKSAAKISENHYASDQGARICGG